MSAIVTTAAGSASFIKPSAARYSSLSRSRDLGAHVNFSALLSGVVGSQSGAATLFFKIETLKPARLGIRQRDTSGNLDRFIRLGISSELEGSLPLNLDGYAIPSSADPDASGSALKLEAGIYYFTVACERWQSTPFEAEVVAEYISELAGTAQGSIEAVVTIRLFSLGGVASGQLIATANLQPLASIKTLQGAAVGALNGEITLGILSGVAEGQLVATATLRRDWKLEGIASGTCLPKVTIKADKVQGIAAGSCPSVATISTRRSYGYDY